VSNPTEADNNHMAPRPIMIAVGGDSGTGKTTLCRGLDLIFGAERIETISLDDYHSLDREQRKAVGLTALNPRANNFAAMEEDMWALREGRAIDKPIYDHTDGTFKGPEHLEPKEIVVVQGLFPLYTRALRSLFDVTVWLDPETEIKAAWKIQRDTLQRGYSEAEVLAEMERRVPDVEAYINPQAKSADLTVTFYRPADYATKRDPAKLSARIRKGGRFRALDYSEFESSSTSIRQNEHTSALGFPETTIELDGHIERSVALAVEDKIWSHMDSHKHLRPENLGEFKDAEGNSKTSYSLALAQLLIARRVVLVENELMEMVP
jgi:phosphoribulokinase